MNRLQIEEDNTLGDNLVAEIDYEGRIAIQVEEPWAGDTETGFGRSGAIRLTREQALQLADWLRAAAAIRTPSSSEATEGRTRDA